MKDVNSFCVDVGWKYGFLFRINRKNFIKIRWFSFGELVFPRVYLRLFGKVIIESNNFWRHRY